MQYLPSLKRRTRASRWEELLARQIAVARLPPPVREHRFHPKRKWRFDFAWPPRLLAVEVEGGIFKRVSRHSRGMGFVQDTDKYNAALLLGWRVLRFTHIQIRNGEALHTIREALAA